MINYNFVREGKTCAIWTRVSTKHQEENGGSLESQKEFCDDYASRYGYRIAGRFGGKHESARTPGKMVQEMVKFVKRTPQSAPFSYLSTTVSHACRGKR